MLRRTASAAAAETNSFTELQTTVGGLVGVAAIDTGTGKFVGHWPDSRFAMCSTFKWLLAAQCLALSDKGELKLNEPLKLREADLLDYAPAAKASLKKGSMTVADCCKAMVEISDNTAANLVLARLGGPAAFTAFCRSIGDDRTRLDRNEPSLNTNFTGDQRDTTTPRAMAQILQKILLSDGVLSLPARDTLIGWMVASKTGLDRLRGGLPKDWKVGDKTGTGNGGAVNDVAIAWPPDRAPIVIASYLTGSKADLATLNNAHAEVARMAVKLLA
jgi:beta-lactamase class A